MRVAGLVELGNVHVDELRGTDRRDLGRSRRHPICHRGCGHVSCTAEHGGSEAGVPVPRRADDHRVPSLRSRGFEQGGNPLPGRRIDQRIPAGQLVDHTVVRSIEHAVADHAVLAGLHSSGQCGESGCRRGRKSGFDDRLRGHRTSKSSSVARAGLEDVSTQPIDEHDDRIIDGWQREAILLAIDGIEATSQHIGKAQSIRFGRR